MQEEAQVMAEAFVGQYTRAYCYLAETFIKVRIVEDQGDRFLVEAMDSGILDGYRWRPLKTAVRAAQCENCDCSIIHGQMVHVVMDDDYPTYWHVLCPRDDPNKKLIVQ